jgi:hypothetical protein
MPASFGESLSGASLAVASLKAASAQGFSVNEAGGKALIGAINTMYDGVTDALRQSTFLGQEPPLGMTPAALVYKPFLATVATDPDQGFIVAMKKFQQDLLDAKDSIQKSMDTYKATDEGSQQGVNKAGSSVHSV